MKYQPQISGLRFCAVFFVVMFHYSSRLMNFREFYNLGSLVAFFFVLSSYLITRILLNARRKAVASGLARGKVAVVFLFRRTLRIFPAYYFYLILLMLLPVAGAEARTHAGMYFSYLSNFQLFLTKSWGTYTVHFWTLSVEEQFYLTWPWFILFIPDRWLPRFFAFLIAAGVVFRVVMMSGMNDPMSQLFPMLTLTPACIDCFAVGAWLAWYHNRGRIRNPEIKWTILAIIPFWLFLIISKTHQRTFVGLDRLFVAFVAALVIDTANRGFKGLTKIFLENSVVQYLSRISYGVYIYHMIAPVFVAWWVSALQRTFGGFGWLEQLARMHRTAFFLYVLTAIGCATLSWYCLEVPLNRLKNVFAYFLPKRKGIPASGPQGNTVAQNMNQPV